MAQKNPSEGSSPQSLMVLMVENSEDDALLVLRALKKGGYKPEYERVETAAALRQALQDKTWDIILCDYQLPAFNGMEALDLLQQMNLDIPLIVVSGVVDEGTAVECMRSGARDYVMKSNLSRLTAAVARELEDRKAREKSKQTEESLRQLSQAMEQSPATVVVTDIRGNIEYVNPQFTRSTGYTPEEVMGKNPRILKSGMQPPEYYKELWDTILSGNIWRGEFHNKRKDGALFWEGASISPIRNAAGKITHFVAVKEDITTRKQFEEALRESEEKYRLLAENSNDWIYLINQYGKFQYSSPSCGRLTGYSSMEFINNPDLLLNITHPDDKELVKSHLDEIQKGANVHNLYFRIITKEGECRWIDHSCLPIYNDQGQYVGRSGTNRDITERKRAEDELKESKSLIDAVVENVPLMIFLKKAADLRFVIFNRAGEELIGYDRAALLGKNDLDLFPPEQAAHFMAKDREVLDGEAGMLDIPEEPILTAKKGRRLLHTLKVRIRGSDNNTKFLLGISEDITERKQFEETLRESEDKFRKISMVAQDGIIMIDNDGMVTFWNPAAEHMFGFTGEEITGRSLHKAVSPGDYHAIIHEAFPRWQASGQGQAIGKVSELRAKKKDGSEITVELTLSSVMLKNKWHAVGIVRDITQRKQAEEKLNEANYKLIQAAEYANELIIKANVASQAKSDFLANMSHEIRTPMNGVIGMTGLLLDTDLNEEQRKHAQIVRTCGEFLMRLINDILDFSKIEAGKLELETLNFDLRALLDDFAAMMAGRIQDKGLEFVCAVAADVPTYLRGDPGRLRQILVNLAGNAVKFTHQGEITIRVNLILETEDKIVARFSVKDTGIGISADNMGFLFQKFSQVDASTTRHYGGTGLGLAISKQLVEMMGGEIGIKSEEGSGSEFWFTVCLAKQYEHERIELPLAGIRGSHILIVDDNATNREILTEQFRAWGVQSEEAPDGPMALQALYLAREGDNPFHVAILDMQMPGMDGATLGRMIKSDDKLKNIRLVMMTSVGQRGDAKLMEEIGFAAYLIKPVRQADLFEVLSVVLAGEAPPLAVQPLVTRHSIRELRRGSVRILLAEDDFVNQDVALGILKKLGFHADAVSNGAEAVKALETTNYDLVLMDVQMPEVDGLTATRIIRDPQSAVRNHKVPVIAMTAYAMKGDREKCLEAGMNDYVPKPVEPQALADALEKWLPQDRMVTQEKTSGIAEGTPPASVTEPAVFDRAGVMARVMDDEYLARKVIGRFLDVIPTQIEVLHGFVKSGAASNIERQAHTIKGASATCGGEAVRAVALKMEEAARDGDLELVAVCFPELEKQLSRMKEALNEFINRK
ncbi:MAG: PAS domain S-box protein [Syntrophus sp. (in: bacteria)]